MKKGILLLMLIAVKVAATAQLKVKPDCGVLTVDVYKGWINEVKPNADPEYMKTKLPCFTSFVKESNAVACGGGVYFDDKGIRFYTQRDYIVITDKFKGKFTAPVLGVKKAAMFAKYGNPKLKDANWEAYQMAYGIMVVYYNKAGVINKVIISTKSTEEIDVCDQ